jgi:hypothetical protein
MSHVSSMEVADSVDLQTAAKPFKIDSTGLSVRKFTKRR